MSGFPGDSRLPQASIVLRYAEEGTRVTRSLKLTDRHVSQDRQHRSITPGKPEVQIIVCSDEKGNPFVVVR